MIQPKQISKGLKEITAPPPLAPPPMGYFPDLIENLQAENKTVKAENEHLRRQLYSDDGMDYRG